MNEKINFRTINLSPNSIVFLDFIRGIAAQAVLFGHAISYLHIFDFMSPFGGIYIQNISVVIFFILSGILITKCLIRAWNQDDFYSYFIDRFVRIYVSYIPCLFFVFFLDLINISLNTSAYRYKSSFNIQTFIANIFMLQDFPLELFHYTSFGSGRPFWTLAIEWWLYMATGLLLYFAKQMSNIFKLNQMFHLKNVLTYFILGFVLIVPYANIYGRGNGLTLFWLLGSFIYIFISNINFNKHKENSANKKIYLMFLGVLIFSFIFMIIQINMDYNFNVALMIAIGFLSILIYFENFQLKTSIYLKKISTTLASYSFTIYLIHYSVLDFLTLYCKNDNKYFLLIFSLILCNALSFILAYFTELKHNNIQQKIKTYWKSLAFQSN